MPSSTSLLGVHDHYRTLVGFVARKRGSRQDAHDVVHDAWLRVAERHPELSCTLDAQNARAYLYAVAENLVIDHFRHGQRTHAVLRDPAAACAQLAPDVTDAHCLREAIAAVDHTLTTLPKRCRAIFLANRLDGTPQAEIAAAHGISVKTVEREILRAMDAMEKSLYHWRGEAAPAAQRGRRKALSTLLSVTGLTVGSGMIWSGHCCINQR